jgi:hypothetical protein
MESETEPTYVACQIVDDCTDQQKAQDWLAGVAGKMTTLKILSCNNYGGERIFKMPEPNSLGEGSLL